MATGENREAAIHQLTGLDREEAEWALEVIEHYEKRMVRLDKHMAAERKGDKQIERIMKGPGVDPGVFLAFVAFLGDGSQFENTSQVSNYLGLVSRVDMSGTIVKYGETNTYGHCWSRHPGQ
ncbi:transposase [Treponema primitia]